MNVQKEMVSLDDLTKEELDFVLAWSQKMTDSDLKEIGKSRKEYILELADLTIHWLR